jgi:hypothetical protein
MGYMRHNAVIVTAADYAMRGEYGVAAPDVEAFRESLPEEWRRLLVGPVQSVMNGYLSFAFLPDGSKEGWGDSDLGDEFRQRFIDLFAFAYEDGSTPFDVLVIDARFGGDEPGAECEPELIVKANPRTTATGD